MARKKQEVKLQFEIETQEEWEDMLSKEGVTVVDVYAEWAGPCKAIVSNFRKLKMEAGDDLLHFAIAKSDTVDALEKYRGRCKPCFLFYAGGVLVYAQRGAELPVLLKAINVQLIYEHKVLDGTAERKEITDTMLESQSALLIEEEQGERAKREVTLAIVKPNVIQSGQLENIINQMKDHGIEILEQSERTLTKEEAQEFYAHKKDEDFFEELCDFMSSGPSVVLVLSKGSAGGDIVQEWRELLGPANVEEAKESAPESLRAKYGTKSFVNAVHGSDSGDMAMQELAFFFPTYTLPSMPQTPAPQQAERIQRTLALIRPDCLKEKKDEILAKIEDAGFIVAMQKEIQLTREQAGNFYTEHKEQPYFNELIDQMTNGPLLALALAREDAVQSWRDMLGPKDVAVAKESAPQSLRAQFAVEKATINQLHGSDSQVEAKKEIEYFFPVEKTLAAIKPDAYKTRDEIINKIKQAGFHVAARKDTELTPEIAQKFYEDLQDKDYFNDLVQHMTKGTTLFMVLTREDAVSGWRGMIGPTDPQLAKTDYPDSLRAQFGTDIKANGLHGSSTTAQAKDRMELVFGSDVDLTAKRIKSGSAQQRPISAKSSGKPPKKRLEPQTAPEGGLEAPEQKEEQGAEASATALSVDTSIKSDGDVEAQPTSEADMPTNAEPAAEEEVTKEAEQVADKPADDNKSEAPSPVEAEVEKSAAPAADTAAAENEEVKPEETTTEEA